MNSSFMNIFYVAIVLAVIFLILAIVLFFVFNIPKIVGSLTGKTSKREIKKIREGNSASGVKKYKSSIVNEQRGKVTDKIVSGELVKQKDINFGEVNTDKLSANETTVLNNQNNSSDETTVLSTDIQSGNETTVLSNQNSNFDENTTVLGTNNRFEEEEEICFSESSEIIT